MQRINYETGETWDDGLPEDGTSGLQEPPGSQPPDEYMNYSTLPEPSPDMPTLITNKRSSADEYAQQGGVSHYFENEDMGSPASSEMRTGVQDNGTPWASNVPGWEPPPPKPDLTEGMPKLYNQQKAKDDRPTIPGAPPGEPGWDTTRSKFEQFARKQIVETMGEDPVTMSVAQFKAKAWAEANEAADEARKTNLFVSPNYQGYNRRVSDFIERKKEGLQQLSYMMDKFDKDMEQNKPVSVAAGATLVEPITGKVVGRGASKEKPVGMDNDNRIVMQDITTGRLTYEDGTSYRGGPLNSLVSKTGGTENDFKTWTPEAKKQSFVMNVLTKEVPASVKGLGGNDRKAYAKEYAQWQVDTGFSPQDIALMQADYRAGDVSLKNMAKQEGPMDAFVGNINKQIAKVKQLYDNNDRTGLRMLDLPVRELKTRALGSGEEAVKASYLLEISNEIGKLSSGASASVQQLSDSAKEDWKKVHDVNLSMKDIMTIVNATRDQANMRMESWREAKQDVRRQLGEIGKTDARSKAGGTPPAKSLKEGFNTNFANGQTWTLKNGKPVQVR